MYCQETWLDELDENIMSLLSKDFSIFSFKYVKKSNKKGRVEGTNAWFVKNKLKNFVKLKYVNKRISYLILSINKSRYAIVGCYLSYDEKAFEELVLVEKIITAEVNIGNFKIIVLGDFNADIGRGNIRDKKFRAWVEGHNLVCLNMLYKQKIQHTFLNTQGHFSALDQIFIYGMGRWYEIMRCNVVACVSEFINFNVLASEGVLSSYGSYSQTLKWLDLCRNVWDIENFSDHRAIALVMNVDKIEEFVRPIKHKRLDWLNKKHVELYSKTVHKNLICQDVLTLLKGVMEIGEKDVRTRTMDEIIRKFHECVLESKNEAERSLGTVKSFTKRNEWWSEEMEMAKRYRNICYKIFRIFRTDEYRYRFSQARKQFKRQMKIEKRKVDNAKALRLNRQFRQHRILYWKSIKRMRNEKVNPNIALEDLTSHYSPLLTEANVGVSNATFDNDSEISVFNEFQRVKDIKGDFMVDIDEVTGIIRKLKNNKAIGHLGVSNEMWKYAKTELVGEIMTEILNVIINTNTMPDCLNVGLLVPIIKDVFGDNSSLGNTRPITISDTIANILEIYMKKKATSYTNRHKSDGL